MTFLFSKVKVKQARPCLESRVARLGSPLVPACSPLGRGAARRPAALTGRLRHARCSMHGLKLCTPRSCTTRRAPLWADRPTASLMSSSLRGPVLPPSPPPDLQVGTEGLTRFEDR
jgi:hypothetical protein